MNTEDGNPHTCEEYFRRAEALLTAGHITEAVQHAAEAVRLGAGGDAPRQLWAASLAASGELHAAIVVMRAGDGSVRPTRDYVFTVGMYLARAGLRDHALHCFDSIVEHDPGDLEAAHIVAALTGRNPEHPNPDYVRRHFDAFAAGFEQQLAGLHYAGPAELKNALQAAGALEPPWDTLDLGCGTGLVAAELSGLTRRIDGVDLAPQMIERARRRELYTQLKCGDLLHMLEGCAAQSYDLIVAADVMIYVGGLDAVVAAARRVLRSKGMFAFTAEAAEWSAEPHSDAAPGYWLQYTGRYAHSKTYLEALAARHGFDVRVHRRFALRLESGRPVAGWSAVWSAVAES